MRRLLLAAATLPALAACVSTANNGPHMAAVVFFSADSASLDEFARANITHAAEDASANPSYPVRVLGFAAPDTGTPAFNNTIARARAQNVADGLIAAGVAPGRVRVESRGAVPFALMPTESRRVEIMLGS